VIPENEGGWWIREVGLFDESGALIAVGNCAESYKPLLAEGSGRTQTVRMILITSSTDNVTLKIDPSIVLATRQYVGDKVIELTTYIDDNLAKKQPLDDTLTDLSGKDVAALLDYLGLTGAPSGTFPIGMPFFWPSAEMPNELLPEWSGMGFLRWNGATFSSTKYPKLARIIPSLTLVEARGEFPRIWDDGLGVDSGRGLLSTEGHGMPKLAGNFQSYDIGGYEGASGIFSASKFSGYIAAVNGEQGYGTDIRVSMDSSTVIPESNEVRPRNIAFNFLVRAK